MALDILRVVQIMWALGDALLTGGAFALLGVYGGDSGLTCRRGGLALWTLCGLSPLVLYAAGYVVTFASRQLDSRHPANWKLLTMLAAANNITIGLLYQHRVASCSTTVTKVLLATSGAMPVWGALLKQLIKGACGQKRDFGSEHYHHQRNDFVLPAGAMAAVTMARPAAHKL